MEMKKARSGRRAIEESAREKEREGERERVCVGEVLMLRR
jgi:hypothetical protein